MNTLTIPLTRGAHATVDEEDYDRLSRKNWYLSSEGYAARRQGRVIYMHREIMNAPENKEVDHINNNRIDNRKANLRFATRSEQTQNSRKQTGYTTSQFKGVHYRPKVDRWQAGIKAKGKAIYLGRYYTEEDAALAYDIAARQYFGKWANPNFTDEEFTKMIANGFPQRSKKTGRRRHT